HTRFSRDWSSDVCSSDLALMTTRQLLLIACGFITSSLCIHSSQEEPKIIFLLKQKLDMHIKELENAVINVEKIPEWESCINNKEIGRASCREKQKEYKVT